MTNALPPFNLNPSPLPHDALTLQHIGTERLVDPFWLYIALSSIFMLLLATIVLFILWQRERQQRLLSECRLKDQEAWQQRCLDKERELTQTSALLAGAEACVARLEANLEQERRHTAEKIALLEQAERRLHDQFKSAAYAALKDNNSSFLQLAEASFAKLQQQGSHDLLQRQEAINQLVTPLKQSLSMMENKLGDLEKERLTAFSGIKEQLCHVVNTQKGLRDETANLVKALRQPQVRGRWGEMQLKRVVEMAGMVEHCDFDLQCSVDASEGWRRPDMMVRLPAGQSIIVDAKTPLSAYLDAVEEADDEVRQQKLQEHARQLRHHIDQLGKKSYWDCFKETPEFVVLFLPGESFYSAALQHDPSLLERGMENKVVVATPMTLIALLRAVAYGWRQESLAQSAADISAAGRLLYERLAVFTDHFSSIKRGLDQAVRCYNNAVGSFDSRLGVAARRLFELGAATSKPIKTPEEVDRLCRAIDSAEMVASETAEQH